MGLPVDSFLNRSQGEIYMIDAGSSRLDAFAHTHIPINRISGSKFLTARYMKTYLTKINDIV